MILLHGTGGHAEAYLKNIEAHAKYFHVYAIDMVGHGYTDAPDISHDMQCYVDFMKDFLDVIGAHKAHISGESLGAALILDSKLVILENSGHWPQWEEPEEFNKAHIEYLLK